MFLHIKYTEEEILKITQTRLREINEISKQSLKMLWAQKNSLTEIYKTSQTIEKPYIDRLQDDLMNIMTSFYSEVYKYTLEDDRKPQVLIRMRTGDYTGELKNNNPDGIGLMVYDNEQTYEGTFKDGIRSGLGVCYYPNGEWYKGQWANDTQNGYGVFKYQNEKYEGQWVNGKKDGSGVFSHTGGKCKGDYFEGQWKDDKMHGKGIDHVLKERFEGNWENGVKHGLVIHVFQDEQRATEFYDKGNKVEEDELNNSEGGSEDGSEENP